MTERKIRNALEHKTDEDPDEVEHETLEEHGEDKCFWWAALAAAVLKAIESNNKYYNTWQQTISYEKDCPAGQAEAQQAEEQLRRLRKATAPKPAPEAAQAKSIEQQSRMNQSSGHENNKVLDLDLDSAIVEADRYEVSDTALTGILHRFTRDNISPAAADLMTVDMVRHRRNKARKNAV
ncbi:hypothetical protein Ciccas_000152 [Cichlidogyrus casuarinus]|uniref:Uncharacterized protein n=1 Tax=Cichlidogyrus casuarinus TaxID=1844966 RepID=A0ABD2QPT9_9PLAT